MGLAEYRIVEVTAIIVKLTISFCFVTESSNLSKTTIAPVPQFTETIISVNHSSVKQSYLLAAVVHSVQIG